MTRRVEAGDRFSEWTVVERAQGGNLVCQCSCGVRKPVRSADLIRGKSTRCKRCSCLKKVDALAKHGLYRTAEYNSWQNLKARCTNSNRDNWADYGGRGIKVCDRWMNSFEAFLADMGPKPSRRHSIERYDVDGDYCPENCGWETQVVQARNQRSNVMLEVEGQLLCAADAAKAVGITPELVYSRRNRGWADSDLLKPFGFRRSAKSQRSRGSVLL